MGHNTNHLKFKTMLQATVTKFEPKVPYTKKDGSQSVVTIIAVKIGDITKFDTYGQPYQSAQIVEVRKFGVMADRFAQLALQVGQQVNVELDFSQNYGHTEVDIYSILPAQQQAAQYSQPQPLNYQQPQQPSVFPNSQTPY